MGDYNKLVCESILREMRGKNIRRQDLSNALGVSYDQVCNLLNGRCKIDIDKLYTIANVLDVPVESLL